jgi:hypothetical protein
LIGSDILGEPGDELIYVTELFFIGKYVINPVDPLRKKDLVVRMMIPQIMPHPQVFTDIVEHIGTRRNDYIDIVVPDQLHDA